MYKALVSIAHGMTLRQAERHHDAPYTSLHRAWVALEGNISGPKWDAFKQSCPQRSQMCNRASYQRPRRPQRPRSHPLRSPQPPRYR